MFQGACSESSACTWTLSSSSRPGASSGLLGDFVGEKSSLRMRTSRISDSRFASGRGTRAAPLTRRRLGLVGLILITAAAYTACARCTLLNLGDTGLEDRCSSFLGEVRGGPRRFSAHIGLDKNIAVGLEFEFAALGLPLPTKTWSLQAHAL